jgi:hypothetical protein
LPLHWCTTERTLRLMSCSAFCVYPLACWAPILRRLYGSAASLPQLHRVMYVNYAENTSITLKLELPIFTNFVDFFNKVVIHDGRAATAIIIVHICLAIFELPKHCDTFLSLITLGP